MAEILELRNFRRVVPLRPLAPVRAEGQRGPVAAASQPDERTLGEKLNDVSRMILGPREPAA